MKESLMQFWEAHSGVILALGYNAMLAIVILIASRLIAGWTRKMIQRSHQRLNRIDATLVPILSTTASYLVYIIGGVFILDIFGVNTTSIIALLGAAGLAVGFALKDTLSNIAAGVMLLFLRPFRTGDFIEFGGITGTVKEVHLFTTILETFDGLYIASPNSVLWSSSIKNFTRNGKRRLDVTVGIAYEDSIDKGLEVLRAIIQSEARFIESPQPQALVLALADSSVNLQLRGWTTVDDYWQTLWDLNKLVKEEIERAGLTIPFPQRQLHLVASGHLNEELATHSK